MIKKKRCKDFDVESLNTNDIKRELSASNVEGKTIKS